MLAFHNGVPAGALAARLLANVAADTLKNGLSTWVSVSHVGIHTGFLAFHINCGPTLSIVFGEKAVSFSLDILTSKVIHKVNL